MEVNLSTAHGQDGEYISIKVSTHHGRIHLTLERLNNQPIRCILTPDERDHMLQALVLSYINERTPGGNLIGSVEAAVRHVADAQERLQTVQRRIEEMRNQP